MERQYWPKVNIPSASLAGKPGCHTKFGKPLSDVGTDPLKWDLVHGQSIWRKPLTERGKIDMGRW